MKSYFAKTSISLLLCIIISITNAYSATYANSTQLDSPQLSVSLSSDNMKMTLSWYQVSNATSYSIYCNGELLANTQSTTYTHILPAYEADFSYYIIAKGNNNTLSLPSTVKTVHRIVANPDTSNWYAYEQPDYLKLKGSPLDVSFLLDAPAGKYGRIIGTQDNKFVFQDGTTIQFWGINVAGRCPTHSDSEELVERLAQKGINLVRLHLMDTRIYRYRGENGRILDEDSIDRLCYLLSKLKARGIYYMIDQTVGRPTFEDDQIEDVENVEDALKIKGYYDEHLINLQMKFSEELLTTFNPYTGIKIGADPALALIDLKNEDSLVSGGSEVNTEYYSEYYDKQLRRMFSEWLLERYKTRDALKAAWAATTKYGLRSTEDPTLYNVEIPGPRHRNYNGLEFSDKRKMDSNEFLAGIQMEYYRSRIEHLRSLGVTCMIVGATTWGDSEVLSLYTNAITSDYVDSHYYYQYPRGGLRYEPGLTTNGHPSSMLDNTDLGIVGLMVNRTVYGIPHTISEWNSCLPNPYTSEAMLLVPSYSRLQGLHPILFEWGGDTTSTIFTEQREIDPTLNHISLFVTVDAWSRPDISNAYPAASLLFLRQDVKESENGYYPTRLRGNDVFDRRKQNFSSSCSLAMIGKTGMIFDDKKYDEQCNDNDVLYLAKQAEKSGLFVSETGEMATDFNQKLFRLNTSKSQAMAGFAKGVNIEFDDITMKLDNSYATVYLSSLTNEPIWDSDKMLLTTIGRVVNSGQVMTTDGTKLIISEVGTAPVLIEPITGTFVLKTKDDVEIYALTSSGERKHNVTVTKTPEGYSKFNLRAQDKAMSYEIVRTARFNGIRQANPRISLGNTTVSDIFTDLSGFEYAKKAIERNSLLGILEGATSTAFSPGQYIKRRDFVSALVKALSFDVTYDKSKSFANDVFTTDPDYRELAIAFQLNIILGGYFYPNDYITRQDMMTYLAKAIACTNWNLADPESFTLDSFSDKNSVSPGAAEYIRKTMGWGYVEPVNNMIAPSANVPRADAAVVIYKLMWK